MSDPSEKSGLVRHGDNRYSLKAMIQEVQIERRESQFGRQLVDATEIEKMFSKSRRKRNSKKS